MLSLHAATVRHTTEGFGMDGLGTLLLVGLFGSYPLLPAGTERIDEWGIDRFAPIHADRQLQLTQVNAYVLEKRVEPWRLQLRLGATAQRASGYITQLEGRFEDGTLRSVTYDSPGWGIGPTAEARFALWRGTRATLALDGSAALLVHDRRFPAGGLHYNGMFQIGPSLVWSTERAGRISVGARWTHLSNGHGQVSRNPSYEGRGIVLRWHTPI